MCPFCLLRSFLGSTLVRQSVVGADTATAAAAGHVSNRPDLASLSQNLPLSANLLGCEHGAKRERMRLRAPRRIRPVGDNIDHEYDTHDGRVGQHTQSDPILYED